MISTDPRSVIDGLPPITLDELTTRANLQVRQDRKYLLNREDLQDVARALPREVQALEIGRQRCFSYRSDYYDTAALTSYLAAARPRRSRYKVRLRSYLDSGQQIWEGKTRGARGATIKDWIECQPLFTAGEAPAGGQGGGGGPR